MKQDRNKLYAFLLTACLAGYIWLFGITKFTADNHSVEVCLIKLTTNVPCPSCGTTRSIMSLIEGNLKDALQFNPFGILVAVIMLIVPIWVFSDLIFKTDTLIKNYRRVETYLSKPKYAIPLVLLVIFNWIWNITKGL